MPWPHVSSSDVAREFALCLHACNALYATCHNACRQGCETVNDGEDAASECAQMCQHACIASARDCKVTCRPTPEFGGPARRLVPRS